MYVQGDRGEFSTETFGTTPGRLDRENDGEHPAYRAKTEGLTSAVLVPMISSSRKKIERITPSDPISTGVLILANFISDVSRTGRPLLAFIWG
jgi:hypothetical protein